MTINSFKSKLQQNIINPVNISNKKEETIGIITQSNQKQNTCSVQYIDNDGNKSNKDSVPVRLYSKGIIGWFPKQDDVVVIVIKEHQLEIIGIANNGYIGSVKSQTNLKADIISDSLMDVSNGFLF